MHTELWPKYLGHFSMDGINVMHVAGEWKCWMTFNVDYLNNDSFL